MARRLRIQFPDARYHVINRGNLPHDIFATAGARRSFAGVTDEACGKFGWRMHAYIVMRNHFHFALETPEPNLVAGMHSLQSTFAVRLLRFHGQHGHVFQGRYKSPVIQDDAHLARVCDYIHLNPVRAGVVTAERLEQFASSSLSAWLSGSAPTWLRPAVVMEAAGESIEAVAGILGLSLRDREGRLERRQDGPRRLFARLGHRHGRVAQGHGPRACALGARARSFAIRGEGTAVGAVGASAGIGTPGKRPVARGTGVSPEERAVEESVGA